MYIDKKNIGLLQNDSADSQNVIPDTSGDPGYAPISPETPSWGVPGSETDTDPGYAPISPETPSWGPPSNGSDQDPGFAPISPETPSWGPPGNGSDMGPGFAPISPETPSWGPPGNSSNGNISVNCPSGFPCSIISGVTGGSSGSGSVIFPVVMFPGQTGQPSSSQSNVRFLYAATGQLAVNIRLGNQNVINRLQYGNSTPYYLETSGYRTIRITNSLTGLPLYQGVFYLAPETAYTFALINSGSGISLMQLIDTPCQNSRAACVRAVNLSPNSGPVDVFLSGVGRAFQNVDTFGSTNYRSIWQGTYRAYVSETLPCTNNSAITFGGTYVECNNTRIAILDSANVNFMNGVTYTLYIIGRANQLPALQILSLESDLVY